MPGCAGRNDGGDSGKYLLVEVVIERAFDYYGGMTEWARTADEELLAAVSRAQLAINSAEAEMLRIVAEVDARGLASAQGFKNTADLLTAVQRVTVGAAEARVRVARKVVPGCTLQGEELAAPLSETAAALAASAISFEQARIIEQTITAVPAHLAEVHSAVLERDMAEHARSLDPTALRKMGKQALAYLDPDGPKPRDGAPVRNRMRLRERGAGFELLGWLDSESAAIVRTALSPLAAPTGAHAPGECEDQNCDHGAGEKMPDPRSMAERDGDALVELARRMLQVGELPSEGGARPQVTVTISLDNLRGEGAGLLEAGDGIGRGVIRAEDARRIACDAGIIPIALGSESDPIDVGRKHRLVHPALRRILNERDGGCAFPNCAIPARWTDAHHVRHWAHGGETNADNMVLLCPKHHRVIHKGEWTIELERGVAWFHAPKWLGVPPARNMIHRPDLVGRRPEYALVGG
jgi:hypothetical protein